MLHPNPIRAGIVGAAGYTGGELLRLLLRHPFVSIAFAHSRSAAGMPVHHVHADLLGDTDLCFSGTAGAPVDVLFLCMGHGESGAFLAETELAPQTRVIDLSQDFRLEGTAAPGGRLFVYGLPELNRDAIRSAANIANPGCFATAIQLGLLPLAKAGLLAAVHTTGITGSTGAGNGLSRTTHFSWRSNNIQAYKTLQHQHLGEIHQSLHALQPDGRPAVQFVPWRGDFTRGIYTTSVVAASLPLPDIEALYRAFYQDAPFTHLSTAQAADLKQVVNTNKCVISLEQAGDAIVIHTAIDNLLKGASGQAVQNMNLLFGFPETAGLLLKASAF